MNAEDILPPQGQLIPTQVHGDGYLLSKELAQLFYPYLIKDNTTIMASYPRQGSNSYSRFHAKVMFYYNYQGCGFSNTYDFGKKKYQDVFIQYLYHCNKVLKITNEEHNLQILMIPTNIKLVVSFLQSMILSWDLMLIVVLLVLLVVPPLLNLLTFVNLPIQYIPMIVAQDILVM